MSRMVRRLVQSAIEEHPGWNDVERDHLERPRYPEAAGLLGILPALELLPLGGLEGMDVMPLLRLTLEGVALDCEREGDVGTDARQKVGAFLDALHDGLHDAGHDPVGGSP